MKVSGAKRKGKQEKCRIQKNSQIMFRLAAMCLRVLEKQENSARLRRQQSDPGERPCHMYSTLKPSQAPKGSIPDNPGLCSERCGKDENAGPETGPQAPYAAEGTEDLRENRDGSGFCAAACRSPESLQLRSLRKSEAPWQGERTLHPAGASISPRQHRRLSKRKSPA